MIDIASSYPAARLKVHILVLHSNYKCVKAQYKKNPHRAGHFLHLQALLQLYPRLTEAFV